MRSIGRMLIGLPACTRPSRTASPSAGIVNTTPDPRRCGSFCSGLRRLKSSKALRQFLHPGRAVVVGHRQPLVL
ncbi:MAG: hypothetical protein ACRDRL_29220, partial [Sciscionella sp.]